MPHGTKHDMLHLINARCVACDLHTIAPWPLERTSWEKVRSAVRRLQKSYSAPLNAVIIITTIIILLLQLSSYSSFLFFFQKAFQGTELCDVGQQRQYGVQAFMMEDRQLAGWPSTTTDGHQHRHNYYQSNSKLHPHKMRFQLCQT